ncbi:hypothetical protein [Streptomyces iconiensis]|uniref:Uncharacterized protein n=1 Tax=Streptomyces iconiensis TaxID=1384038 RepID=A0ABT6ZTR2_9ACTN|nr:hypothetical protein [Streptomyces iconiensis]MDJ1132455.1 hypothetical protein [Streptomyces iconiensis]
MSAPARARYLDAILRIVAEPRPAAHYQCLRCPYTASARGKEKATALAATIRTTHRAHCPANQKESTTP